jgi:hypothetical protein
LPEDLRRGLLGPAGRDALINWILPDAWLLAAVESCPGGNREARFYLDAENWSAQGT